MSLSLSSTAEELRSAFFSLHNRKDIARLLDIDVSKLTYYLYGMPESQNYTVFTIRKNLGGVREISAPITPLKIIQRKLNQVLQSVYKPKMVVHSYIKGEKRSILTNAKSHVNKKLLLNIDLKDFFPSINFGRVQGLFLRPPNNLNKDISNTLAKICCYNKALPQGAPTSPVVSNMICARMDSQLSKLARDSDCTYTRYADDITFSCENDSFLESIAAIHDGKLELGGKLTEVISNNGFDINYDKVKLRTNFERQVVTGVTTNLFPNVRREFIRKIRAMLHAWEKYGLDSAQAEFLTKYDKKQLGTFKNRPSFQAVVKGKIDYLGMIRGKDNPIYLHFRQKLRELAPELVKRPETPFEFLTRTSRSSPVRSVVSTVLSTKSDISRLLFEVDPGLESKRQGAWQTFHGMGSDRLSQASLSMREVIRLLLYKLAPDDMIKAAPWYNKPTDTKSDVIRKMRVRYCLSGCSTSVSHSTLDYVESLARFIDETYTQLSKEVHSDKSSDISMVKAFLESGDIIILIILLNKKV